MVGLDACCIHVVHSPKTLGRRIGNLLIPCILTGNTECCSMASARCTKLTRSRILIAQLHTLYCNTLTIASNSLRLRTVFQPEWPVASLTSVYPFQPQPSCPLSPPNSPLQPYHSPSDPSVASRIVPTDTPLSSHKRNPQTSVLV